MCNLSISLINQSDWYVRIGQDPAAYIAWIPTFNIQTFATFRDMSYNPLVLAMASKLNSNGLHPNGGPGFLTWLCAAKVVSWPGQRASLLGARTLLGAPGLTASNKKLLGARASLLVARASLVANLLLVTRSS